MKRVVLVILILMSFLQAGPAYAATVKCTSSQLVLLNKLAKDFNDNRMYFLKFVVSMNQAIEGMKESVRDSDRSGEMSWFQTFQIASDNSIGSGLKAKSSQDKLQQILSQCRSGYGINYEKPYGFIQMRSNIKGIRFPNFLLPNLSGGERELIKSSSTSPSTHSGYVKLDKYFNKTDISWIPSSRSIMIECLAGAPIGGKVKGLEAILAISSYSHSLAGGEEWFPKQISSEYLPVVKTWVASSPSFKFIKLETDLDEDPCGFYINFYPPFAKIGTDVRFVGIFLTDSTNSYAKVLSISPEDALWKHDM